MTPILKRILLGGNYTGLLDTYSGGAAAWSLRKLRGVYGGAAINVRRSSDNATLDIGFTSLGDLDTSALLAFCNGGSGYVTKWYDQSGNGLDRVQASTGAQPIIVSSGSLVTLNGKVSVDFTGGAAYMTSGTTSSFNYLHNGTKSFISLVQNANNLAERFISTGGNSSSNVGILMSSAVGTVLSVFVARGVVGQYNISSTSTGAVYTSGSQFILGLNLDTGNATAANRLTLYINGGANIANNSALDASTASNANASTVLSAPPSSTPYTGKMQEMIFWNTDQTNFRTGILANQKSYYGTY